MFCDALEGKGVLLIVKVDAKKREKEEDNKPREEVGGGRE